MRERRGLPVSEKSNPIAEYIKTDGVKIECEITKSRNMCGKSCLAERQSKMGSSVKYKPNICEMFFKCPANPNRKTAFSRLTDRFLVQLQSAQISSIF